MIRKKRFSVIQIPRSLLLVFGFIFTFSLMSNLFAWYRSYQRSIVTHVVDGDSFDLADGRRIRLLGLDAPERGECKASESGQFLRRALTGRHVRLKDVVTDDYGRLLANVIIEDFDVWMGYLGRRFNWPDWIISVFGHDLPDSFPARALVSSGFARYNSVNAGYKEMLTAAQNMAKSQKRGIWSDTCRNPLPQPGCTIKGNIRADKKTYFLPACYNYDQVIVDTSYGDRWFCTEGEAMGAGFSRSGTCT